MAAAHESRQLRDVADLLEHLVVHGGDELARAVEARLAAAFARVGREGPRAGVDFLQARDVHGGPRRPRRSARPSAPPSCFTESMVSVAPFTSVPRSSPSRHGFARGRALPEVAFARKRKAREHRPLVGRVEEQEVEPAHEGHLHVRLLEVEERRVRAGFTPARSVTSANIASAAAQKAAVTRGPAAVDAEVGAVLERAARCVHRRSPAPSAGAWSRGAARCRWRGRRPPVPRPRSRAGRPR